MELCNSVKLDTTFKEDVFKGLTSYPKYLASKYIYDTRGDRLFQDIMALDEYYLTNAELEIFETQGAAIAEHFRKNADDFDLIELGAGDGMKTKVLLRYMTKNNFNFTYTPIDISEHAIDNLVKDLSEELPTLKVAAGKGEYFEVLERLHQFNSRKKVIMVLGSNIGNLLHEKAVEFLSKLRETLNPQDLIFMGFDQKKNPEVILNAYNDPAGITAAFNKNLLVRINKEMEANFAVDKFSHWESYDPENGTAKSYLVASESMIVEIKKLGLSVKFDQWETIHTEISQKYDDKVVSWLASESGLKIMRSFSDTKVYFKDYLFKII